MPGVTVGNLWEKKQEQRQKFLNKRDTRFQLENNLSVAPFGIRWVCSSQGWAGGRTGTVRNSRVYHNNTSVLHVIALIVYKIERTGIALLLLDFNFSCSVSLGKEKRRELKDTFHLEAGIVLPASGLGYGSLEIPQKKLGRERKK